MAEQRLPMINPGTDRPTNRPQIKRPQIKRLSRVRRDV
jgi:hypothetical protein